MVRFKIWSKWNFLCVKFCLVLCTKQMDMRTNIEIDDKLMKRAQKLSKIKTKKQIVEQALENFIKELQRKDMLNLEGKVQWDGDLDEMRKS